MCFRAVEVSSSMMCNARGFLKDRGNGVKHDCDGITNNGRALVGLCGNGKYGIHIIVITYNNVLVPLTGFQSKIRLGGTSFVFGGSKEEIFMFWDWTGGSGSNLMSGTAGNNKSLVVD